MAIPIRIKRGQGVPDTLLRGEMAYDEIGRRLFIGEGTSGNDAEGRPIAAVVRDITPATVALSDLGDVDVAGATDGDVLSYDSSTSSWVAQAAAAASVAWGDITSKPSTFTPSAHKASHATGGADALSPADIGAAASSHTHSASDITSGLATVATTGAYSDLSGTPTLGTAAASATTDFAAASHSHAWGDITSGVPATFAPSAHTHPPSEITQGGANPGQVLEWSGSAWVPATPSGGGGGGGAPLVTERYIVFEHFINNSTTPDRMVAVSSLSPITSAIGNADIRSDGRIGGVNVTTGTTASANQHTTWRMANSTSIADFEDLASAQYTTEIKGLNLADGTTTGIVYVGIGRFSTTPGSDPSHGVYFRSTDGGNWYAVTRASGTETATDTGVATNTTAWQRLTVKYTSSSCTFWIDGVLKATNTTNIPTVEANFGMSLVKTAAVSGQIRYGVDWLYGELEYDPALSLD